MIFSSRKNDVLYLLILSSFFYLWHLGKGSLASFDESFYAIVSRNIFHSGDFIHLRLFENSFYDKPPLYMWVSALFFKVGGVNEFTIRLFSALAGVGTVITTYFLGRKLYSRAAGLIGAGVLMSSRDFLHYSRWGVLDIANLFFFTLAFLFFFKAKENSKHYLIFWLAVACAVLTKGAIILFGGMIIAVYCLWRRDFSFVRKKFFWFGFMAFWAIVLPWHILFYFDDPDAFIKGYIQFNYVDRVGQTLDGHEGGPFFYIKTMVQKFRPWIFVAFPALAYSFFLSFKSPQKYAFRFMMLWIVGLWAFFSFAVDTKLAWYMFPIYPALALSVGVFIARALPEKFLWVMKVVFLAVLILHIPTSDYIKDHSPQIKELSAVVKANTKQETEVFLYRYFEQPAAEFYWERPMKYLESLNELKAHFKTHACSTIAIFEKDYLPFEEILLKEGYKQLAVAEDKDRKLMLIQRGCSS